MCEVKTYWRAFILLLSLVSMGIHLIEAASIEQMEPQSPQDIKPRIVGGRKEMDLSIVMWQAVFLEKGMLLLLSFCFLLGAIPFLGNLTCCQQQRSKSNEGLVICGGSVISHNKVITAAHCAIRALDESFTVRIGGEGSTDGKKFPIVKTYRHENFTRGEANNPVNDLMVVEFHNKDKKLGMWAPVLNDDTNFPPDTRNLTTSGHGRLGIDGSLPGHLRSVEVPVVPFHKCAESYSDIDPKHNICAGNEKFDSCKGDSGGPLWTRSEKNRSEIILVGVVSYGYGCAEPNAPGVYSRISGYIEWVKSVKALPPTEYFEPPAPLWRLALIIGAASGAVLAVATVLVILFIRRIRGNEVLSDGNES